MTPGARLEAAIHILDALETTAQPADRFLRDWFAARRYAGSKDRAAIAARVYDVLRHHASYAWRMGQGGRAGVLASLLAEGMEAAAIAAMFSGDGYAPAPPGEDEKRALAAPRTAPSHVEGEYPEWLEPELRLAFGETLPVEMKAMQGRAPVDLRVNALRAMRGEVLTGLRALGFKADATPYSPHGIRLAAGEGLGTLQQTPFFQSGAFEIQDEASQIASMLCGAYAGMNVLDLAAGAGGKTLALAALMNNDGHILAFDNDPVRMKPLAPRARRAGATIITTASVRGGALWGKGKFDVVLLDSPCTGSGTWWRSPEQKWRLTQERLESLHAAQAWLLDDAARHVEADGRLVYATCSILPSENENQVTAFLARHPDFEIVEAQTLWHEISDTTPPGMGRFFRATPDSTGTNGFFTAILRRFRPAE